MQVVVSCSNCEAEFRAMATTTREIVHVRRLLGNFDVFFITPTLFTCDNQSAMKIATNPVFHARTKHIEINCYFTRQYFTSDTKSLSYIRSEEQIEHLFTKPHATTRFGALLANSCCLTHHESEGVLVVVGVKYILY